MTTADTARLREDISRKEKLDGPRNGRVLVWRDDVVAALDALEAAEKRANFWRTETDARTKAMAEVEAERDELRTRAEQADASANDNALTAEQYRARCMSLEAEVERLKKNQRTPGTYEYCVRSVHKLCDNPHEHGWPDCVEATCPIRAANRGPHDSSPPG